MGNGGTSDSAVPVKVTGLSNVTAIAAGFNTGYALGTGGVVWAWGYGYHGALGNGATTDSSVPVPVTGLSNVTAIACGEQDGYAITH